MTDLTTFTDADTTDHYAASLGPEYFASNRLAEAMMAKFDAEHLKPLVDKVADEFRDKLWSDVVDYLLADTEQNVAGAIRQMVEQTVQALLTGKEWAMNRYPYADYSKGEEIRAAVAKHGGDTLLARRVADLEAELEKSRQTIEYLRRY
ncbi:hypothetical protein [Novosphingobium sp. HII-3]|uniref:hypothetical protein n=1 Tax=Novosphingobium sp. HII-3 TaxID=2075565 RepID=UPI000CDA60B2|nr:hypothetical protein [Novosphingobium sp. HII-3]